MRQQKEIDKIRISISQSIEKELKVASYITDTNHNTKQLAMSAWLAYYLPLAMIKDENNDIEILETICESVCQLRAQIDIILLAAEIHGLNVPERLYTYSATTSVVVPKIKKQTQKHQAKSKPIEHDSAEGGIGDEQQAKFRAELYDFE